VLGESEGDSEVEGLKLGDCELDGERLALGDKLGL